jgi:CheY-like chemotaxis protein
MMTSWCWGSPSILERTGFIALQSSPRSLRKDLAHGRYDLVLTDLNVPGMSGWDVAQSIREHHPDVPVCAVSGRITDDLDAAWLRPFSAVLGKPVDEDRRPAAAHD